MTRESVPKGACAQVDIQRVTIRSGDQAWLVTGYETIRRLLTDHRLGRTHPRPEEASRFSQSAAFDQPRRETENESEDQRRIRRTLLRSMSSTRASMLRPRVTELASDLLDRLDRAGSPGDFHGVVSQPLPAMVICELLGLPDADREALCAWSAVAAERDGRDRARAAHIGLCRYMAPLIASRKENPGGDLLSELAREQPQRAAVLAADLFLAGHLTTSAAIDKALVVLLCGEVRLRDVRDTESLETVVEELVRIPFPGVAPEVGRALPRYASSDLTIAGERVKAGDLLLLAIDDANLDDAVFARPSSVELGRQHNPHLGFGHGPYSCVGASLARMEMIVLLELVATRFPDMELAVPFEQLPLRDDLITGGLRELLVRW